MVVAATGYPINGNPRFNYDQRAMVPSISVDKSLSTEVCAFNFVQTTGSALGWPLCLVILFLWGSFLHFIFTEAKTLENISLPAPHMLVVAEKQVEEYFGVEKPLEMEIVVQKQAEEYIEGEMEEEPETKTSFEIDEQFEVKQPVIKRLQFAEGTKKSSNHCLVVMTSARRSAQLLELWLEEQHSAYQDGIYNGGLVQKYTRAGVLEQKFPACTQDKLYGRLLSRRKNFRYYQMVERELSSTSSA